MDTQKTQIIERLNQATNILVTVSTNPSVDQLAGAIGLTLLLNKLGKHATAVFSGKVPSTLEFLQPDKTLEKNTDSLRDFIIALDKSKADKLRYKVEDQMVKIFITPYRTSISDKDLEFSQGDFNVEVVMALGVNEQPDLDQAITSHGRILHDATVIGVAAGGDAKLGAINWVDHTASSLCEMLVSLGLSLKEDILDGQMATAFLTGIVAETNRFSNEKTSSETMQMSARLMSAGANQQLVATQLQTEPKPEKSHKAAKSTDKDHESKAEEKKDEDGSLSIEHADAAPAVELPEPEEQPDESLNQIHIDQDGEIKSAEEVAEDVAPKQKVIQPLPEPEQHDEPTKDEGSEKPRLILDPPTLGGKLTANTMPEGLDPSTDPLTNAATTVQGPLLSHDTSENPPVKLPELPDLNAPLPDSAQLPDLSLPPLPPLIPEPTPAPTEEKVPEAEPQPDPAQPETPAIPSEPESNTLTELEKAVESPHLDTPTVVEPEPSLPPLPPLIPEPTPAPTDAPPEAGSQPDPAPSAVPQPPADLDAARDAVMQAMNASSSGPLPPVQALNAQPMDLNLGDIPAVSTAPESAFQVPPSPPNAALPDLSVHEPPQEAPVQPALTPDASVASDPGLPPGLVGPDPGLPADPTAPAVENPIAPPPVPPPIMPPEDNGPAATAL